MEQTEEIILKGKHAEMRTAPWKQKKRNAHLTTATVTEIGFQFSSTEDMKWDPAMA